MKSHGDTIADQKITDEILISFIEKFDYMVVIIEKT